MPSSIMHYHESTSYHRNAMAGGYLDWSNQPGVFKRYPGAPRLQLPMEVEFPAVGMQELMRSPGAFRSCEAWGLEELSKILRLTCAITARSRHPGGDFLYRSTPSAGALYPCEIYLAASGVKGLSPALYHYSLEDHCLEMLRPLGPLGPAPRWSLTFFLSVIFFRSSWKYRERAYRYLLLDTGHVLENLILALRATNTPYRILLDFQDDKVNSALALDPQQEACLAMVQAGAWEGLSASLPDALSNSQHPVPKPQPPAPREMVYPAIVKAHEAGNIPISHHQLPAYKMLEELGVKCGSSYPLEKPQRWPDSKGYVESLWRRRSQRAYVPRPMDRESFYCLLEALDLKESFACAEADKLLAVGFLAREVEGLPRGFYLLDMSRGAALEVARGDFSRKMASACLDQGWMAQAALQVIFLSNLEVLEARLGARAYRHAMMLSGRMGQRIYLASTALGLGACAVGAFYDQEAASLLGLNPCSKLLYVVTSGPVRSSS